MQDFQYQQEDVGAFRVEDFWVQGLHIMVPIVLSLGALGGMGSYRVQEDVEDLKCRIIAFDEGTLLNRTRAPNMI